MRTLPLQMRFNDVDNMGHVNNAVIMEYFDLGKSEYFASLKMFPETGDFTVIVVHVDVDFHAQIFFRDNISVQTCVCQVGNKSLHLFQRIVRDDGTLCASCRTVMSGYSRASMTSAPIPDDFKKFVEIEPCC